MNIKAIFRGVIISLVFVAAVLFISAVFVYFNILSEKTASVVFFAAAIISIFLVSLGIAKTADSKLLLNAMSVAFLFSLIVFITSTIVNGEIAFHTRTITLMGGAFGASFLGALLGK